MAHSLPQRKHITRRVWFALSLVLFQRGYFVCVRDEAEGSSRGFLLSYSQPEDTWQVYLIDWGYINTYPPDSIIGLDPAALRLCPPLAKLYEIAGAPTHLEFPQGLSLPLLFQIRHLVSQSSDVPVVKVRFNNRDLIDYYYDPELVNQSQSNTNLGLLDSSQKSGDSSSVEEWLMNTADDQMSHISESPIDTTNDEELACLMEEVGLGDSVSAVRLPTNFSPRSATLSLAEEMCIKVGDKLRVLITYTVLPTFFNFTPITEQSRLYMDSINTELSELKDTCPLSMMETRFSSSTGRFIFINDIPYRVVVRDKLLNFERSRQVRVQLIDTGAELIVDAGKILNLAEPLSHIPVLRCNGLLHGLAPSTPGRWSPDECEIFRSLTEGRELDAEVTRVNSGKQVPSFYLDLSMPDQPGITVAMVMHSLGFGSAIRVK